MDARTSANIAESNSIEVELRITDARLALTFLDLMETTEVAEERARRISKALKARTSILHFLTLLTPTAEQDKVLKVLMGTLDSGLKAADALGT